MKQDKNSMVEAVLAKHMGPEKAPDSLWHRIQNPRLQGSQVSKAVPAWFQWASVATTLVVLGGVGAGLYWAQKTVRTDRRPETREAIAIAALTQAPDSLPLQTADTAQIRRWVKANSGIDIPLPPKHAAVIEVIGARMIDGPNPLAEISYQVGDYKAALLVAKDPTGKKSYPSHGLRPSDRVDQAHVSSWSMRGQSYTLASNAKGDEFETACLLCHDQTPSLPSASRKI
jgi:hypothetical protein